MKTIFAFCFVLLGFTSLYSQNNSTDSAEYYSKVFGVVQQKPTFPGNQSKWMADHTIYPKEASDSNIQGTVYLSLIIEKDGSVSGIKVMKGVQGGSCLDSEAIRVVSIMPKWSPGVENGHLVRVQLTLPVKFKLIDPVDTGKWYSYGSVEVKPIFPEDIKTWVSNNTGYPKIELYPNEQDTVYISFIIERNGSISHVQAIGVTDKYLNSEAVSAFYNMPKCTPGMKNGQIVKVICMLPIRFVSNMSAKSNLSMEEKIRIFLNNPIDTIYTAEHSMIIQEKPKFPGDLNKWLTSHIEYPQRARDANIQGTEYITFIIESDGSISDVSLIRGANSLLDEEAIKVVSAMPKWIPGKLNGQPACVQYMIPIHFVLGGNSSPWKN